MDLKLTPSELKQYWCSELELCKESSVKPADVEVEEPPAITAFRGRFWETMDEAEVPNWNAQFNLGYQAVKWMGPLIVGHVAIPAATSISGNTKLAKCHNKYKEYRDRENRILKEYQKCFHDCFLRGTAVARTHRCPKKGMAVTKWFDVRNLYIDRNAKCLEDAEYIIERHSCPRWEFARMFGYEIAEKIKADDDDGGDPQNDENPLARQSQRITYYLAWCKTGDERRVYAFHENFSDEFLNVGEDGLPGEPWPSTFDDEDFHITQLRFTPQNDTPWGLSYYEACKGPIRWVQFLASYMLSAAAKSSQQTIVYPKSMHAEVAKILKSKKHLQAVAVDDSTMDEFQTHKIKDLVQVLEYPSLPTSLIQAHSIAMDYHDKISGQNAVTQMDPTGVETAVESKRLSDQASSRVSDDVHQFEIFTVDVWRKEVQVDYGNTPRRSIIRVNYGPEVFGQNPAPTTEEIPDEMVGEEVEPEYGAEEVSEASDQDGKPQFATGVNEQESDPDEPGIMADIPYEQARQICRGVGNVQAAQQEIAAYQQAMMAWQQKQAMMQQQMMMAQQQGIPFQPPQMEPQPELDPRIQARLMNQIPLEVKVEMVEVGIEGFVRDPDLASAWDENMSPEEIKCELDLRIEQGSTRVSGHMEKFNEASILYKTLMEFNVQWRLWPQAVALHNYLLRSIESTSVEGMEITVEQLMQSMQQIQQEQMQQQQQMMQQEHQNAMEKESVKQKGEEVREKRRLTRDYDKMKIGNRAAG